MYNICTNDGRMMLGAAIYDRVLAEKYLDLYRYKYIGIGQQFKLIIAMEPNHPMYDKGQYLGTVHRYPDGKFAVGVSENYKSTLVVRRYLGGAEPPNFPVPAIPLRVVGPWSEEESYRDMIFIDSLQTGEEDPNMVACWDFWTKADPFYGQYQRCWTVDVYGQRVGV